MEILALLIPVSVVLIAIAGATFVWAVNHDQFDDLEKHGFDVLDDDPTENYNK
jgi:cbb3-type cytochrome oxidase maturation protein